MSIEQTGVLELETLAPAAKSGDTSSFTQVNFPAPFPTGSKVVVVTETQTFNDGDTPGLRIADVTPTGFKIRFNELTSKGTAVSDGVHYKEMVAWKATTIGMRQTGTAKVTSGGGPVTNNNTSTFSQVTFPTPFPTGSKVGLTASVQTFNGPDSPGLRIAEVTNTGFKVRVNELVASPGHKALSDGNHTEEVVSWVAYTHD